MTGTSGHARSLAGPRPDQRPNSPFAALIGVAEEIDAVFFVFAQLVADTARIKLKHRHRVRAHVVFVKIKKDFRQLAACAALADALAGRNSAPAIRRR